MKHIKQFCVILAVSFAGDFLNRLIPLPIPPGIYGLVILFGCLCAGVIGEDSVGGAGGFLLEIMPVMFIPAAVGIIDSWEMIKGSLLEYAAVTVISTFTVTAVSGAVTETLLCSGRGGSHE